MRYKLPRTAGWQGRGIVASQWTANSDRTAVLYPGGRAFYSQNISVFASESFNGLEEGQPRDCKDTCIFSIL